MSKRTKWIISLVAFGVIAVGAVVGIIVGRATHDETVEMSVCWRAEDHRAEYVDEIEGHARSSCANPEPFRWATNRRPLKIRVTSAAGMSPPEAHHQRMVDAAVSALNSQMGCDGFAVVPAGQGPAGVSLEFGHPAESGDPVADCSHLGGLGGATAATIRIRNFGNESAGASIVMHELGHAGGLGHDVDDDGSVMRPFQPDELMPGLPLLHLNDADARWLAAELCGR